MDQHNLKLFKHSVQALKHKIKVRNQPILYLYNTYISMYVYY
jgi:hypothetical protein